MMFLDILEDPQLILLLRENFPQISDKTTVKRKPLLRKSLSKVLHNLEQLPDCFRDHHHRSPISFACGPFGIAETSQLNAKISLPRHTTLLASGPDGQRNGAAPPV
jgi:hypothetical protein